MSTRKSLAICVLLSLGFGCAPEPGHRSGSPNILLILTDDQGWSDIHSHGNETIQTPTLDGLAAAGARFDRFFVSPVCAPTRASLLTGRYYLRTGVHGVTRGYETMRAKEVTLAEREACTKGESGSLCSSAGRVIFVPGSKSTRLRPM
jgi:hypothetical protein